jgi:hypothetical protein
MDTRFWGPSGWKLLHLISFTYDPERTTEVANFLETIPYILPCKFCRASLTDYYRKHPYATTNGTMIPSLKMDKWMYTIHNCVNAKLRKQGLHPEPNPTFQQVKQEYDNLIGCSWEKQITLLWDFLFAVAYHHPKESSFDSKPMPECPEEVLRCKDKCEKNKWNVLPWKERMYWFRRFWVFLPAVLPKEIGEKWEAQEKRNPVVWDSRRSMMAWLWRMRCGLDARFHDPYLSTCKAIAQYSSDCGTKRGAITCRRKRHRTKTVKKQRQ